MSKLGSNNPLNLYYEEDEYEKTCNLLVITACSDSIGKYILYGPTINIGIICFDLFITSCIELIFYIFEYEAKTENQGG